MVVSCLLFVLVGVAAAYCVSVGEIGGYAPPWGVQVGVNSFMVWAGELSYVLEGCLGACPWAVLGGLREGWWDGWFRVVSPCVG